MEFSNKQELIEYLTSLEERLAAIEPKDEPSEEPKDAEGDGKVNEDVESVDEIEKLLED
jgi:hypothetical protein